MKLFAIEAYQFNELSKDIQDQLIDENEKINIESDTNWYQADFQYSEDVMKHFGIEIKHNSMMVNKDFTESRFAGTVNLRDLIIGVRDQTYKKDHASLEFYNIKPLIYGDNINNQQLIQFVEQVLIGKVNLQYDIDPAFGDYGVVTNLTTKLVDLSPNLEISETLKLINFWVAKNINHLNYFIRQNVSDSYESLTSYDSVKESLSNHITYYTKDGEDIGHLIHNESIQEIKQS